ncbi:homeobox protein PKNOX1-like [Aricia agestis]|uniref:homeobox protein PKNOX1-like n=1 Tax=Aricia agestis TaxID=91739 RepID=UPI001C204B42|nr:homeobox protein PKNOX1-like [Aricia agestis]
MQGGGGGAPAADADQAQFEADKRAVYKHPLFPLLALLLERCEQATAGAEAPAAEAFGADLQAFVQHQRRDRRPFLVDDPEIDGLMIKSIQVLRIHLLELEKVQELCRDFCGRYIACLKTKMQSENLLRTDYTPGGVESNNNLSGGLDDHSSTSNSPQYQSGGGAGGGGAGGGGAGAFAAGFPGLADAYPLTAHPALPAHPAHRDAASHVVQGSTPISQIGAGLLPTDSFTGTNSNSCSSVSGSPPPSGAGGVGGGAGGEDEGEEGGKRGVLPRHATQVMRAWLFQHLVHPYPTEEEKRSLAAATRLTLLQVNNWFINARRRILQPMLDCADKPGGKKSKNGSSISKRYWPDALTNPQFTAGLLSSEDEDECSGGAEGEGGADGADGSGDDAERAPYSMPQTMH